MTKGFSWAPLLTYLLRVLFGSHQILGFIGAWSKIDGIVLRSLHLRRGHVLSYSLQMTFYFFIYYKRLKINDHFVDRYVIWKDKYLTRSLFFISTFVKNSNSWKSAAFPIRILIGTVHQILYLTCFSNLKKQTSKLFLRIPTEPIQELRSEFRL